MFLLVFLEYGETNVIIEYLYMKVSKQKDAQQKHYTNKDKVPLKYKNEGRSYNPVTNKSVVVPFHAKDLSKGTERNILRQAGLL